MMRPKHNSLAKEKVVHTPLVDIDDGRDDIETAAAPTITILSAILYNDN